MLVNVRSHMMFRPEHIYNCQPNDEMIKYICLSFKKSLQNRTTNWNKKHHASLQRSEDLPLEKLREKQNDKMSKAKTLQRMC